MKTARHKGEVADEKGGVDRGDRRGHSSGVQRCRSRARSVYRRLFASFKTANNNKQSFNLACDGKRGGGDFNVRRPRNDSCCIFLSSVCFLRSVRLPPPKKTGRRERGAGIVLRKLQQHGEKNNGMGRRLSTISLFFLSLRKFRPGACSTKTPGYGTMGEYQFLGRRIEGHGVCGPSDLQSSERARLEKCSRERKKGHSTPGERDVVKCNRLLLLSAGVIDEGKRNVGSRRDLEQKRRSRTGRLPFETEMEKEQQFYLDPYYHAEGTQVALL